MCGIAGILKRDRRPLDRQIVGRMTQSIKHRGPDDEGFLLVDSSTNRCEPRIGPSSAVGVGHARLDEPLPDGFNPTLGLGWRRLSIIDLSVAGHQPMSTPDGDLWVIFNGEIYNYVEIREDLRQRGHKFRSGSDTEVLLHAWQEWGEECLQQLRGMWAFALFDRRKGKLICCRDRFGIKPLYYIHSADTFAFASEIKALLTIPDIPRRSNAPIVWDFLNHRLMDHSGETFFEGIHQLRPGHLAVVTEKDLTVRPYYTLRWNDSLGSFNEQDDRRYREGVAEHLSDSVAIHLRSDVPVGSCLSGGLDSSTIVCLASRMLNAGRTGKGPTNQKTFTATYNEPAFSEDRFVNMVVKVAEVIPESVIPTPEGLLDDLTAFITAQDEPVISTSVFAQWNVMRLASQHRIPVLLDGQGGDELFGGYRWHLPVFLGQLLAHGRAGDAVREMASLKTNAGVAPVHVLQQVLGKLVKHALPNRVFGEIAGMQKHLSKDFRSAMRIRRPPPEKSDANLQLRLAQELTSFNLQQLLHFEDRNSMAYSIEARVPFLDHRLVEYVMSVPAVYKIRGGWTKYLLRSAMGGVLPEEIRWRKDKMGFVTPESSWLDTLRSPFTQLLQSEPRRSSRFIDPTLLDNAVAGRVGGMASADRWRMLNLELWMRTFNVS